MNSIIKHLLSQYNQEEISNIKYPYAEVLQKIILCSLSKLGFYKEAVFHGGTCLRIFHGLERFSEDLDFSIKNNVKNFNLEKYIDPLINNLKSFGLNFTYSKLDSNSNVNKCTLSINLYELVKDYGLEKHLLTLRQNQQLKIKLEVDTNPPYFKNDDVEEVILYEPAFCIVSVFNLSTMFAGKINAILTRPCQSILPKGRDYYDYLFYVSKHIKPNLAYLQYSLSQFKIWNNKNKLEISILKNLLENNFKSVDMIQIKNDVSPLIKDQKQLDVYTNNFFLLTLKDLD